MVVKSEPHNISIIICIKKKIKTKVSLNVRSVCWVYGTFNLFNKIITWSSQDCMFMGQIALPLIQTSQY